MRAVGDFVRGDLFFQQAIVGEHAHDQPRGAQAGIEETLADVVVIGVDELGAAHGSQGGLEIAPAVG